MKGLRIVDMRCPACNEPVGGAVEVAIRNPPKGITQCGYCQTPVTLVKYDLADNLAEYGFRKTKAPRKKTSLASTA